MKTCFILALILFAFSASKKMKGGKTCKLYFLPSMERCQQRLAEKQANGKGYVFEPCTPVEMEDDKTGEEGYVYAFTLYKDSSKPDGVCVPHNLKMNYEY